MHINRYRKQQTINFNAKVLSNIVNNSKNNLNKEDKKEIQKKRIASKNLLKATRIERTFPIVLLSLIPFGISNGSLVKFLSFVIPLMTIYSSIAILNAIKDKDYDLPKYSKKLSYALIILSVFLSLFNKYALIYVLLTTILGFIYNEFSRKIILGDSLVAGITHFSLPFFLAGQMNNLSANILVPTTIILYFLAPSIAPITNIKDLKEDRKRGYKTLINSVKKPNRTISFTLISIETIFILIGIILKKPTMILIQIIFSLILIQIKKLTNKKYYRKALLLLRVYLIYNYSFIIFLFSKNPLVIFLSSIMNIINLIQTTKKYKQIRKS